MGVVQVLLILSLLSLVLADVYLHNPRGSNNRNRERSTNTDNANRLYDSQNNNKGGYSWGPPMTFYEGSLLQIEFTAQHGCGADHPNVDCDVILQYMCHPLVRDGTVTTTITKDTMDEMVTDEVTGETVYKYGMHEPHSYYEKCRTRLRNKGLFTADQNMNPQGTAMQTRQDNNQNNVHGFECVEERDYYPYWHSSPWRDIAILTSNPARCAYFKENSQNVKERFECSLAQHNNQKTCQDNSGQWYSVPSWGLAAPECVKNEFSRDNHLGNIRTGHAAAYSWTLPDVKELGRDANPGSQTANCVFRIRYNITTGDYDAWGAVDKVGAEFVDSRYNNDKSPVKQDEYIFYGRKDGTGDKWPLRLALNTDQFGRTFEDRSHTFYLATRPAGACNNKNQRIINLNVRGKRGNIVETYPATEYDFTPVNLIVNTGDCIHFQWTGSNTNPNYAGEGTQGTDRSNICQLDEPRDNKCMDSDKQTLFATQAKAWEMALLNQYGGKICRTIDEQSCCKTKTMLDNDGNRDQNPQNCAKLNGPVQYFDGGLVKMTQTGTYYYMSTRNNNFSNRSQKGIITVEGLLSKWGVAVASVGAVAFVGASGLAGASYFASTHPQSAIANIFANIKL